MADGVYVGGPITLINGSTAFSLATGTATQVKAGDLVLVDGVTGVVNTFLTNLTGTLKQPWAGASVGVRATLGVNPAGDDNALTYTAVASGVAGNAISVAYVDPAAVSAALSIGVVGSAITVNLATDAGVKASLAVNPAGVENKLTYTAVNAGPAGNNISIAYVDPAANNAVLGVVVVGNAITVNLATGPAGAITSTAAQIKTAVDASGPAAALVTVAIAADDGGLGNGAGVVTAMALANLASGANGAITSTAAQIKTAIDGNAPAAALVTVAINTADTGVADNGSGVVTAMALANLAGGIDAKADYLVIHQGPYWSTPASVIDLLAQINTHISAGGNLYLTVGAPTVDTGRDEDFALEISGTTATIYHKTAGAWDAGTILVGNSVTTGTVVPNNGTGANGDLYIRTSTGDVYEKAAGVWGIVAVITGGVGPIGPLAVPTFVFDDTSTADSDPGSGKFKLDHATPLSATTIYVDVNEEDGLDVSAWLATFGTGGTATNRGTLSLKASDGTQLGLFQVTGLVVGTGYRKITGVMLSALAAGSWTNGASVGFQRSEKGDTGAAGANGVTPGKRLTFSTAVDDTDPGTGKVKANSATFASITKLWIDDLDAAGVNIETWIQGLDDSTNDMNRADIELRDAGTGNVYMAFRIVGSVVDKTGYWEVPVTSLSGTIPTDGLVLAASAWLSGDDGVAGVAMAAVYAYGSGTTDTDPGNGGVTANNADWSLATTLYIDNLTLASAMWTAYIDSWDDMGSTADRGRVMLLDIANQAKMLVAKVTGSVVDGTGYRKVTIEVIAAGTTPTAGDQIGVTFYPLSPQGPTGADGTDPGTLMMFDSSTADTAPATGKFRANNASLGSATFLYVAKTNRIGDSIETWLLGLDNSTNTIKGQITLTKSSTGAQAIYDITGVTDATGYVKIAVQNHSGVTSFTNADPISTQFSRAGDAGAGAVNSVNTYTGTVVLVAGDIGFNNTVTGTAATTTQGAIDEIWADLDNVAFSGAYADLTGAPPGRNLLINPHGRVNQRLPASNADDSYGHDRWFALTQTGTIAVSTLTDVEDGTPSMMRLTQSQATAQRMGYAQIIEGRNCKHLRGKAVVLGGRLRYSNAAAVRYAILEWTGTENAVTSDVVLDWTSATFTVANFFLASNLTVRAVGSLTPAAATLTNLTALTATLGSTFNNLIVFIWTEGTAAQNSTLDLSIQFERGASVTEREFRPIDTELALCQRYYYQQSSNLAAYSTYGPGQIVTTSQLEAYIELPVPMRASPTLFAVGGASDFAVYSAGGVTAGTSGPTINTVNASLKSLSLLLTTAATLTAGRGASLISNNNISTALGYSAEL